MTDTTDDIDGELRALRRSVAGIADRLGEVTVRLDALLRREPGATSASHAAPAAPADMPVAPPADVPASPPADTPSSPPADTPASPRPVFLEASHPVAAWPESAGAAANVGYQVQWPAGLGVGKPPLASGPAAPAAPPPGVPRLAPAAPPSPGVPAAGSTESPSPWPEDRSSSWADTAGSKLLGWVGAAVTILGVVLLLVIASQRGLIGPTGRVAIGVVVGLALLAGGLWLHSADGRRVLGATFTATGLAVEYLAVIAAVRSAGLVPAVLGHVASALIVAASVAIAVAWREHWVAAASFATSGLLAPVIAGDITGGVMVFEILIVAGGAACVLAAVGRGAWIGAGGAAGLICLAAASTGMTPFALAAVIAIAVITWGLFLGRWLSGRASVDPGEFAIRTRPTDPAQIARDYADFDAHLAQRQRAHRDRVLATSSMSVAVGLLVLALAATGSVAGGWGGIHNIGVGITAAGCALVFAVLARVASSLEALRVTATPLISWLATIAAAAVALLRLLDGDARSISWLVLAVLVLVAVAWERSGRLLVPAVIAGGVAILAAGPALHPADLFRWPPRELLTDFPALATEAWTAVLPAGVGVLAVCVAAYGAAGRCMADHHRRPVVMAWMLVGASAVACYGLLAMTMVFAYAVSPTHAGYQTGHIIVTGLIVAVALGLLWQGFRSVTLRIGGLGVAAVAVGKLLLFDTGSLQAIPRAMTVIAVGVLLLVGALIYLKALGRAVADDRASSVTSR